MKTSQWKRLTVFLSLFLVVALFGSLYIGFYEASAASSIHIKFGSGGNWDDYLTGYNDCKYDSQGNGTTVFSAEETNNAAKFDPMIMLYKKNMGYVPAKGHIVQVRVQVMLLKNPTETPKSLKIYTGTTSSVTETGAVSLTAVNWSNQGESDENYQIVEAVLPEGITGNGTTTPATINVLRIDMPDQGAFEKCVFRLVDIYMGPRSSAPYKTVTYKYNTSPTATTTVKELVPSGYAPKAVPTVSSVENGTTKLVPKNTWATGSTTNISAATVKSTKITADTTYTAEYTTQYKVTYNYFAEDTIASFVTSSIWVTAGQKPTSVPTPPEFAHSATATHYRNRFIGTWSGVNPKNVAISKATTYIADYITQWRVTYSNYISSYANGASSPYEYVDDGKYPQKFVGSTSCSRTNTEKNARYTLHKLVQEVTGSDGKPVTQEHLEPANLTVTTTYQVKQAMVFRFYYDHEYKVTFYKADNTTAKKTLWIKENACPTRLFGDDTSTAVFAGWRKGSTSGQIVDETITPITEPTHYYAAYMDNAFAGDSTSSIVVKRKVSIKPGSDPDDHEYVVRLDMYHYGKELSGYIKIMDNTKSDFGITGDVSVYRVPYMGNKVFEDESLGLTDAQIQTNYTRQTTAGGNGFVFDIVKRGGKYLAWPEATYSNEPASNHLYYTMHLYEEGYENDYAKLSGTTNHQKVSNSQGIMKAAYLREGPNPKATYPYGYKYVIFFEITLQRDGTIGGNNVPLSEEAYHSCVEYYSSLTATKPTTTISLEDVHTAQGEDWPNANIDILYDLCPHDFYMDLYDANAPYYVVRGKMTKGSDRTQIGLTSALRLKNTGKTGEGAVHESVYGFMFSHGNEPVYARNSGEVIEDYTKEGLPNTDVNGVRNEKVNIHYTVKHDTLGKIVYETECNSADTAFRVYDRHGEVDVDYLVDHTVTITATVTPANTSHTDYFGRPSKDTVWEHSVKAYYFAPRFVVADSSNIIPAPVQKEGQNYAASSFTAKPSYMFGTRTVAPKRLQDKSSNEYAWSSTNSWNYLCYSFTDTYDSTPIEDGKIKFLNGIKALPYKVQAVNTPKRFATNVAMADRDIVQRYCYVLPSTTITYDQNALTFDVPGNWLTSAETGSKVSIAWQTYYAYNRKNILYGSDPTMIERMNTGDKVGNKLDYNGGSRYTNVDDATSANRNEGGSFTFTGTGFDIYSRCSPDTGILVAQVYDSTGKTLLQNILSDTYLDNATYYQVPVIQWRAPGHGTYIVKFRAYYHAAFDHPLYKSGAKKAVMTEEKVRDIMGWDETVPCTISLSDSPYAVESRAAKSGDYDVYIDGIRIYNPLGELDMASDYVFSNTANKEAYAIATIYNHDKELNPKYFSVNEYIVDGSRTDWFKELGAEDATGVLYIAGSAGSVGDPEGDSDAGPGDGFVGLTLCSTGQFNTIKESYTDSKNNTYPIYYYADKDGNKILDPETGCPIFRSGQNGKIYIMTKKWTAITQSQLELILGNKIAFYDSRYKTIGPAFEVYLSKNNGVAFNATGSASTVASVHISLRSADGGEIKPQVYDGSKWQEITITYNQDRTEQYYDVTAYAKANSGNIYIRNVGDGIMALVNVKVVGGSTPKVNTRTIMHALEVFQVAETPVEDSTVTIGHSLNLASDISLNYVLPVANMDGVESSYLRVELPVYEGNDLVGSRTVELLPELRGNYCYYVLDGLTAVNMNDVLKATLHFVKDGQAYVSLTDEYSIASYAFSYLNKESAPASLKTLCARLLRYGGKAQLFKGYRTDYLADEEMTEVHRSYLSDLEAVPFSNTNKVLADIANPGVTWAAKSLNLESKVAILFMVDPGNYTAEDLCLRVTYTDGNGEEQTVDIRDSQLYHPDQPYLVFSFNGLLAAELRTPVTAAVYAGEKQVSCTLEYSADTYCNGKTGALGQLCKALFDYSDAAKDYFQS